MNSQHQSGIEKATGRDYGEWFVLLDEWTGRRTLRFRQISDWLEGEHGMSSWWAQKLIVEYEQDRGIRPAGVRPDGTFTVGTSKTVVAPVDRVYAAVVDPSQRERWLPGVVLHERVATESRSARFDWVDDGTRVSFTFDSSGPAKSQVAVEHERLPDADTAQRTKEFWKERLTALKTDIEKQED